jgi:hypothetical protein
MKKKIASLLIGSAACLLAVSGLASEHANRPTFEALDGDRSGTISGEEASVSEALMKAFDDLDTDRNAKLDRDEYMAFRETDAKKN